MPKKSPTKPNMMRIYNRTVVGRQHAMLLISRSAGVLANHRRGIFAHGPKLRVGCGPNFAARMASRQLYI